MDLTLKVVAGFALGLFPASGVELGSPPGAFGGKLLGRTGSERNPGGGTTGRGGCGLHDPGGPDSHAPGGGEETGERALEASAWVHR